MTLRWLLPSGRGRLINPSQTEETEEPQQQHNIYRVVFSRQQQKGLRSKTFHITGTVDMVKESRVAIVLRGAGWRGGEVRWGCGGFVLSSPRQQRGLWVECPSGGDGRNRRSGVFTIHISVSATGAWLAECPLVVGAGVGPVPFSGGDSPLTVGLSRGSWGRGATDTRVLAWFSSSTWISACAQNTLPSVLSQVCQADVTPTCLVLLPNISCKHEGAVQKLANAFFVNEFYGFQLCVCSEDFGIITKHLHVCCLASLVAKLFQVKYLNNFVIVLCLLRMTLKI